MLANNALTTLERAKAHLSIDEMDTTYDVLIADFINYASGAIEKYCERSFGLKQYKERGKGTGRSNILLRETPVVSVESVTVDGIVLDPSEYEVFQEEGILYNPSGWKPCAIYGGLFGTEPVGLKENIIVEYTAGYVLPKDEDKAREVVRTLPYELEMACVKVVKTLFNSKDGAPGSGELVLKRERLGDWSVEYETATQQTMDKSGFSTDVLKVLDYWKRVSL